MLEKLVDGRYYQCIRKKAPDYFTRSMEVVLDGKTRKFRCTSLLELPSGTIAYGGYFEDLINIFHWKASDFKEAYPYIELKDGEYYKFNGNPEPHVDTFTEAMKEVLDGKTRLFTSGCGYGCGCGFNFGRLTNWSYADQNMYWGPYGVNYLKKVRKPKGK